MVCQQLMTILYHKQAIQYNGNCWKKVFRDIWLLYLIKNPSGYIFKTCSYSKFHEDHNENVTSVVGICKNRKYINMEAIAHSESSV